MSQWRDWYLDAVFIAHYCPGLGNPFNLTPAQWRGVIDRIADLKAVMNPVSTHEEKVIADHTLQENYERRKKAWLTKK